MTVSELLDTIRDHIRAGAFAQAKPLVRSVARMRLSREDRLRLAFYANDAFLPGVAVRLLHRRVRSNRSKCDATPEELEEYGRAIMHLGAPEECVKLLSPINLEKLPRAATTLSWALLHGCEYEPVSKLMKRVLRLPNLPEFDRLFARKVLADTILHGELDCAGAGRLLEDVLARARSERFSRLRLEALYSLMQARYYDGDLKGALEILDEADALIDDSSQEVIPMLHEKWRIVIAMTAGRDVEAQVRRLGELQARFLEMRIYREYRSCDYLKGLVLKDRALGVRMYYGTPPVGWRRKILWATGLKPADIPPHYDLEVGPASKGRPFVLEVLNGASPHTRSILKVGQIQQRLLQALAADFYSPPDSIQLFARLFPDEHFNPTSSPLRVNQALRRLRLWLSANRIPLRVEARQGVFRLVSDRRVLLRIARELIEPEARDGLRMNDLLARIAKQFGQRPFKAQEVESLCGVSRSLAVAWLRSAYESGALIRLGAGPNTRYSLK